MKKLQLIITAMLASVTASAAQATTIDFTTQGTFTTPELAFAGGTVTGSADINVIQFNGLGIVGGSNDIIVDGSESIAFEFTAPVINVTYFLTSAGNGDANGTSGERSIEIFGLGGTSLGVFIQDDSGSFSLSDLVGAAVITGFELTAMVDNFRVGSISFDFAPSEVPLPAALPLFLAGIASFGAARRKRNRTA